MNTLDLVVVDLGENHLLLDAQRVIAAPVEAFRRQPTEVAHARHCDRDEAIEELVHAPAAQRHGAADRLAFTQVEVRDRLLRARQDRKSTRLNSSHSQISYAVFCLKKK